MTVFILDVCCIILTLTSAHHSFVSGRFMPVFQICSFKTKENGTTTFHIIWEMCHKTSQHWCDCLIMLGPILIKARLWCLVVNETSEWLELLLREIWIEHRKWQMVVSWLWWSRTLIIPKSFVGLISRNYNLFLCQNVGGWDSQR